MQRIVAFVVLFLGGIAFGQSLAPTVVHRSHSTNGNQSSGQGLSQDQKSVWNGELNYFRYLGLKDLKKFMSLWDDNFVGWPDYSEHPLRKQRSNQVLQKSLRNHNP